MDVDMIDASQNSNAPTAQNQPVPNNGAAGAYQFNISDGNTVHQLNLIQANKNSGDFTVNQTHKAAELDDNSTRDIPIGTGQAPGGNPTRKAATRK